MPTIHFFFVGTHFKTSWDSKGMANSFGSGFPIGAGSVLLAGDSKGDTLPWQVESNGGQSPPWQEESSETGGFVAHDLARKV